MTEKVSVVSSNSFIKRFFLYIELNTISQRSETNIIFDSCPFKRPPTQHYSVITLKLDAINLQLETIEKKSGEMSFHL